MSIPNILYLFYSYWIAIYSKLHDNMENSNQVFFLINIVVSCDVFDWYSCVLVTYIIVVSHEFINMGDPICYDLNCLQHMKLVGEIFPGSAYGSCYVIMCCTRDYSYEIN